MENSKIVLEAHKTCVPGTVSDENSLRLQYNPASVDTGSAPEYQKISELSSVAETKVFTGMGSETLELKDIMVDTTGYVALPFGKTVEDYLVKLRKIVYDYRAEDHEPPFVRVIWGTLSYIGKCESFTVAYKLFSPDGTPLRAMVNLKFTSSLTPEQKAKAVPKSSPDLSHLRTVAAGDTLPLMAYRIYGDSSYYLEIARINKLPGVNVIRPGDVLLFPPLKK